MAVSFGRLTIIERLIVWFALGLMITGLLAGLLVFLVVPLRVRHPAR